MKYPESPAHPISCCRQTRVPQDSSRSADFELVGTYFAAKARGDCGDDRIPFRLRQRFTRRPAERRSRILSASQSVAF